MAIHRTVWSGDALVLHPGRSADGAALSPFGHDSWWLTLLKAVLIFVILMLLTLFNIWAERRVIARMQQRIGPTVNGPFGLLQSLADGMKLILKEDLIPKTADKVIFVCAPLIVVPTSSSSTLTISCRGAMPPHRCS